MADAGKRRQLVVGFLSVFDLAFGRLKTYVDHMLWEHIELCLHEGCWNVQLV